MWISEKENIHSARIGSLRITIVKDHIYAPGQWVMHCPQLQIDTKVMGSADRSAQSIKHGALLYVRNKLANMLRDLEDAMVQHPEVSL